MAKLRFLQTFDRPLREDLQELQDNIWLGRVSDGSKSGNIRGKFLVFTLPATNNTEFAVEHGLGEVPQGYMPVGSETAQVVTLAPGGTGWSSQRMYLKSSSAGITVALFCWAGDSG